MKKFSFLGVTLLSLVVLVLFPGTPLFADRGLIPFIPGVQIFEPNQRAMIAWNGSEEILLLSTDLRASQATQVLEVLPLPSEPGDGCAPETSGGHATAHLAPSGADVFLSAGPHRPLDSFPPRDGGEA